MNKDRHKYTFVLKFMVFMKEIHLFQYPPVHSSNAM